MSKKIDYGNLVYYKVKESDLLDTTFESDIDEFTQYFHIESLNDIREKLVQMYLIKASEKVLGYVTLAMAHIRPDATKEIKTKEVYGNIPSLLISHLAVRKGFQRQGLGTRLLDLVFVDIIPNLETFVGCRYVMLNPRNDEGVRKFYNDYGFVYYDNFKSDKDSDACLFDVKLK